MLGRDMRRRRGYALIWVMVVMGLFSGILMSGVSWLGSEAKIEREYRKRFLESQEAEYYADYGIGYMQEAMGRDVDFEYEKEGKGYRVEDLSMKLGGGRGLAVNVVEGGMRRDWSEAEGEGWGRMRSFMKLDGRVEGNDGEEHGMYPVVTGVRIIFEPKDNFNFYELRLTVYLWNPWDVMLEGAEYEFEVSFDKRTQIWISSIVNNFNQGFNTSRTLDVKEFNGYEVFKEVKHLSLNSGEERIVSMKIKKTFVETINLRSEKTFKDWYWDSVPSLIFSIKSGGRVLQKLSGIWETRASPDGTLIDNPRPGAWSIGAEMMDINNKEWNERASVQELVDDDGKSTGRWDVRWGMTEGEHRKRSGVMYRVGRLCDVDIYNDWKRPGVVFGEVGEVDKGIWDRYRFGEGVVEGMFNVNSSDVEGWRRVVGKVVGEGSAWELARRIVEEKGKREFRGLGEFVESGVMGVALEKSGMVMRQGELWEGIMRGVSTRGDEYLVVGESGKVRCEKRIQRMEEEIDEGLGRRFRKVDRVWKEL